MTNPSPRPYSGAEDLQAMLDLLTAVRPAGRITDFPSPVDVRELMALRAVRKNTRLWFDARGALAGFAFVDHYDNLRFELAPVCVSPAMEAEIVAWGEACLRRAMREHGDERTLDASCREDDAEKVAFFLRHGFAMQEMRSLRMTRPLAEPIPAPRLPEGFTIRHVTGEAEAGALVALHRAAFDSQEMTLEERLAMMRATEYEPQLDLVAIAPEGAYAAYCMCSISREENERSGRSEGYTDPLATHPAYRRRGLARALLLTGMRALEQRGIQTAVLGTSSENFAMQRAARAVGFRIQSATCWFSKTVPSVSDA